MAGGLPLKTRRTETNNKGTKKMPSTVAAIMPPMTPMPIEFCAPEPAPLAIASGKTPRMKAKEVIESGADAARRQQRRFDQSHACILRSMANSTIRMAFLADKTDRRQQADLEIDVIRLAEHEGCGKRAEHPDRHGTA